MLIKKCLIFVALFSTKSFSINFDKIDTRYINPIKEEKIELVKDNKVNSKNSTLLDNKKSEQVTPKLSAESQKPIDFLFKNPKGEDQFDRVSYGFIFLALICLIALYLLKSRKRKNSIFNKFEKDMKIISTLPLSTKRRIFLIDVKGQLMTLASTEHGIQFMTNIESKEQNHSHQRDNPSKILSSSLYNDTRETKSLLQSKASIDEKEISNHEKVKQKKTDLLSKALESLKKQKILLQGKELNPKKSVSVHNDLNIKSESEQSPLRILSKNKPFPKYLSDSFEDKSEIENNDEAFSKKGDDLDSITKMIKNRIRSMQSAS